MSRYLVVREQHETSYGVIDTVGVDEHPEQANFIIASRMTYPTACTMANLFERGIAVESPHKVTYNDLLNSLGRIARGDSRGGTGELLRLMKVAQEALARDIDWRTEADT